MTFQLQILVISIFFSLIIQMLSADKTDFVRRMNMFVTDCIYEKPHESVGVGVWNIFTNIEETRI